MMATPIRLVLVLASVVALAFALDRVIPGAGAQAIYRSVDAAGNVTYSSTPTAGAVQKQKLTLPEGPSEAERQAALAREQALQEHADSLKDELSTRQMHKSEAVGDAEERLAEAKKELEAARVQEPNDWQTIAGGGRYLKESYLKRVREAEERVRQAEQELTEARRNSP